MLPALIVPSVRPVTSNPVGLAIGTSMQFTFRQNLIGGGYTDYQSGPSWTSSSNAVASVDANGLVTGNGLGSATITGTLSGNAAVFTVLVTQTPGLRDASTNDVLAWVGTEHIFSWWRFVGSNVTVNGSNQVTQVTDFLRPTTNPTLFGFSTGANLPSYDSVNGRASTDGSTNYFWTGESAYYDPSSGSRVMVIIGSANITPTNGYTAAFQKNDISHWAAIGRSGGGTVSLICEGDTIDSGMAPTSGIRITTLWLDNIPSASVNTLGYPFRAISMAGHARRVKNYDTNGALPAGQYGICLGALKGVGLAASAETFCDVLIIDAHQLLPASQSLQRYAQARGATLLASEPSGIFCVGDSRTYGTGATPGTNDWVTQLQSSLGSGWNCRNLGVPSRRLTEMQILEDILIGPDANPLRARNVAWLWAGVNDGLYDGAQLLARTTSWAQRARQLGFSEIGVVLEIPTVPLATRNVLNPGILNLKSNGVVNYVARTDLRTELSDPNNATYFVTGGPHLTPAGYTVIQQEVQKAMGL